MSNEPPRQPGPINAAALGVVTNPADAANTRRLLTELAARQEQAGIPPLEDWALSGALAALESALFSKDDIEARNIAALVCRAFR